MLLGGDHDLSAGFGIGKRIVMVEGNLQVLANQVEFVGGKFPDLPGQLHCATKRQAWHWQS